MTLYQYNTKEEWLNARHDYITASEIGCVLSLDPYKSLAVLAKEKKEKVNLTESSLKMKFGNLMEKVVLRCFELQTGLGLQMFDNNLAVNPEFPVIACSLDGLHKGAEGDIDELIVVDAKMSSGGAIWQWGNKDNPCGVPPKYFAQMQQQMLITGATMGYLAVLKKEQEVTEVDYAGLDFIINFIKEKTRSNSPESNHYDSIVKMLYASGYRFDYYAVPCDRLFQENLVDAADRFWEEYIVGGKEPYITTVEEVKQLAIIPTKGRMIIEEELYGRLLAFSTINEKKKLLEKQVKKLSDELKVELAMFNEGEYEGKKVFNYSFNNGKLKFDEDRFKEEHPELWSAYLVMGNPTRTFTVNIK
jgi:putative phage-type endonuclease